MFFTLVRRFVPRHSFVPNQLRTRTVLAGAFFIAIAAVSLFVVSFAVPYNSVETQLVQWYGARRTTVHFSPAVWDQVVFRLRLVSALLFVIAAAITAWHKRLNRSINVACGAVSYSIGHECRVKLRLPRREAIALALITLLGIFLRIKFIQQPMRCDESATVLGYASEPIYVGLSLYNEPNNHIFHTLLVHFAMELAGSAEWAVRLPAFIAGSLLTVLVYAFARRLGGPLAAMFAAALAATSSILIEYSTNARGYTIMCFATMAMLIAACETFRRASPVWFLVLGVSAVIGFWTIPAFLLPFGGGVVWVIWEVMGRRSRFRRVYFKRLLVTCVGIFVATFFVLLPPVTVSGTHGLLERHPVSLHDQLIASRAQQSFVIRNFFQALHACYLWTRDLPIWFAYSMTAAFICSLALSSRNRRLVVSLASWVALLVAITHMIPFARNWLCFLPVTITGCAISLAWICEHVLPASIQKAAPAFTLLFAILLAAPVLTHGSVLTSTETGVLPSASQIASFVGSENISPERLFRSPTSDLPFEYYWWRRTGNRPRVATADGIDRTGSYEVWFLLNDTYRETLNDAAKRYGLRPVRVLHRASFRGAQLYHVTCTH